jgi:hypothetical protein
MKSHRKSRAAKPNVAPESASTAVVQRTIAGTTA